MQREVWARKMQQRLVWRRCAYFFAGVLELIPCNTEWPVLSRATNTVRPMDVSMKMTAAQVVTLVRILDAPRGPKAVCDPWPPKAPAKSALAPCCNRMAPINTRQTITCTMVSKITTKSCFLCNADATATRARKFWMWLAISAKAKARILVRKRGLEPLCLAAPPPQDGVSANFTTSACRMLAVLNITFFRMKITACAAMCQGRQSGATVATARVRRQSRRPIYRCSGCARPCVPARPAAV